MITEMIRTARLYGPRDMRLEDAPAPQTPGSGEVLLRVRAVGICGSDLHMYEDGRIGDTVYESPLILGHEFMGEILSVGEDARDGHNRPIQVGGRVAVDPACPCYRCEMCEQGNPNLCTNHSFIGVYPTDGAMREYMIVPARNCFPIPDSISDGAATMLETLGIAIHSTDLGKLKPGNSVAVVGCGPVGLLIIQMAKVAGSTPIYAFDKFDWRVQKACDLGAMAWNVNQVDPVQTIMEQTGGRGVDVVFEAGWANESVQVSADIARDGGKVVLVGIPGDDKLVMKHSTPRRKGLTLLVVRRMKHTYPRAIRLVERGMIDLETVISHHVGLEDVPTAFKRNISYETGINKIVVDM
jgi:L-iditol 2-dehydrogenase